MKKQTLKNMYLLIAVSLLTACNSSPKVVPLQLKDVAMVFEYGQPINSNVSYYLDNEEDILQEVTVSGLPKNETDKDYPPVGEYKLVFTHENSETVEQTVYVKDTTAPVLDNVEDTYQVDFGKELKSDSFKATDLSKTTVELQDDDVNYKKAGTYKATVIAKDEYNNETKKEVTVVVKEEVKTPSTSETKKPSTSTNKPSNSSSKPSENNTSNSSSSSSNTSTSKPDNNAGSSSSQTETKKEYDIGNSGMLFDSEEEAINWAEAKMDEDGYETYRGYVGWSTWDKWTIEFQYK